MALIHGGNLAGAAKRFGIPPREWIDISTGISPWGWPAPPVPGEVWRRLPEGDGELECIAADHYGSRAGNLVALPGSQYAISRLPHLLPRGQTALPRWGYGEHALAWQRAGHGIVLYRDAGHLHQLVAEQAIRHCVVINPNNPTAEVMSRAFLEEIAALLARRQGILLADEAFMDATPGESLIPNRPDNAVVLRSMGKFFGLAGIRLGFAFAGDTMARALREAMDPWTVSHPARWLGARALADRHWQGKQRRRLAEASRQWRDSLEILFPDSALAATALFATLQCHWLSGESLYQAAGKQGLLLRLMGPVDGMALVRFGLPPAGRREETLARLWRAVQCIPHFPEDQP